MGNSSSTIAVSTSLATFSIVFTFFILMCCIYLARGSAKAVDFIILLILLACNGLCVGEYYANYYGNGTTSDQKNDTMIIVLTCLTGVIILMSLVYFLTLNKGKQTPPTGVVKPA